MESVDISRSIDPESPAQGPTTVSHPNGLSRTDGSETTPSSNSGSIQQEHASASVAKAKKLPVYGPPKRRGRPPNPNPPPDNDTPKRRVGRPSKTSVPGTTTLTVTNDKFFVAGSRSHLPSRNSCATSVTPGVASSTPEPPTRRPATPVPPPFRAAPLEIPPPSHVLSPTQHFVIPEIDQERTVEIGGDGDEDGIENDPMEGDGKGLGEEEDGGDEEDKDDEPEEDDEESENTQKAKTGRKPLPSWVLERFSAYVAQSSADHRDANGLPPLYAQHRTFFFPQPSTFFLLNNHVVPSPQMLYNPRFFLWDPLALHKNIPCPKCRMPLRRHGVIPSPRRVVDFDTQFWVIGYRYRCHNCLHPRSGKNTTTYRSWDPRIIANLPPALAAEFPAMLTHRSGIAKSVFDLMRSCFQSGMGSKQFSDALRVQHHLFYDRLHLQYLDFLASRHLDAWTGQKYSAFLPFDDPTPLGPRAFTPSADWLRNLYDDFIEEHRLEINQQMALLSAEVCAIDHSHKITKHILRVNGERVFIGLLTITNEKGEIRTCSLVATKSHSQFELALVRIRESLRLYGYIPPRLFYTDNMADKSFLEAVFVSLRDDVVAIEKYSSLPPFELPEDVAVEVKDEAASVDAAISTILDDMPVEDSDPDIVVGFDAEWNVSISEGGQQTRGDIAVIQIAYERRVYIIQIDKLLRSSRHNTLPDKLIKLLCNPRIRKAGRQVKTDLKLLQDLLGDGHPPFVGSLDLARHAKDRLVAKSARVGLSDLTALVLGKCLAKNVSERISGAWEHDILTVEQLRYAASDAFVSLLIFQRLDMIQIPEPLNPASPIGTPCLLYSSDNMMVIARGSLPDQSIRFDDINVTPTRVVLLVTEVLVPGAKVTTHRKQALESFGSVPFHVVCLRSHVRTYDPATIMLQRDLDDEIGMEMDIGPSSKVSDVLDSEDNEGEGLGDVMGGGSDQAVGTPSMSDLEVDKDSQRLGAEIIETNRPDDSEWDTTLHSRVLKDPFHLFNMLRLPAAHALRKELGRILSDIIFIPDQDDRARIVAYGATLKPPMSFEDFRSRKSAWLWRRCKRIIPPPRILYPLVEKAFLTYGPLKDATTQQPLFNRNHWHTSKQILELIRQGFVSDAPGIPLYTVLGVDANAGDLPIYRCFRGTNFVEGGVHTHLRQRLPISGVSIRHIVSCLLDFVLGHNLRVGTFNSTGQKYRGHYSIWLTNDIQERLALVENLLVNTQIECGWVNGNLYVQTQETIGILPIPLDVRLSAGITEYNANVDHQRRHHYLAMMQGTRKAVLPVHHPKEHDMFRGFMKGLIDDPDAAAAFRSSKGPDWKLAPKVWNRRADLEDDIYYKLPDQLKAYYTNWDKNLNIKQTRATTAKERQPIINAAQDPSRSVKAPSVPQQPLAPASVTEGLRSLPEAPIMIHLSDPTPSSIVSLSPPPTNSGATISTPHHDVARTLARQRAAEKIQQSVAAKKTRTVRTCMKCGSTGCLGKQQRRLCREACQDCGKKDCIGRDSDKPEKKCYEVPVGTRRVQKRKLAVLT